MSILINKDTRVLVQGITGRDGAFHTSKMIAYGTNVVAGTSPGKEGTIIPSGVPVYNCVEKAVNQTKANTSIIFVPAPFVKDAIMEAANSGISLIVCITEGVPTLDVIEAQAYVQRCGAMLIGPNCPGLISPQESLVGILPGNIFSNGKVGVISRSGTLTYEIVYNLTQNGLGQSTAIGVGGDPIVGLYYKDLLLMFQNDPQTESIVVIGEIGGDAEEQAAEFIRDNITKPVVSFIAGKTAPADKRMGHAGAIISSGTGSAKEKRVAFEKVGVPVADEPSQIPILIKALLKQS